MATSQLNRVLQHVRGQALPVGGAGLTDGQLLDRFLEHRDASAFEALLRRHGPMVLGVCRRILCNAHDADDAFQATFLVLVRKADGIRPREMVGNWLYGVACQTAVKARAMAARRRARERQVSEMPEPAAESSDPWSDLRPLLDQELSRLPDKYRVPVVLCDLEGKSGREAARQLGCPEGTLTGRLSRARAMLARRLTRRGVTLSGSSLALLLSTRAAPACVPGPLHCSTVQAASLFAAGQAAGTVPAHVLALTEGVLKAMLMTKLKVSLAVLMVMLAGLGGAVLAQRDPAARPQEPAAAAAQDRGREPGRPAARPEVRGIVKSVNAAASTITLTVTGRGRGEEPSEKTYTLAKDVEVGVGLGDGRSRGPLKEAKLTDLVAGTSVMLSLTADEKTVEAILAQGPQVRGILKSVDAGKNSLTITLMPTRREEAGEDKTYTVSPDAEVGVDDGRGRRFSHKEGKLSDLTAGAWINLWLSVDQKQAQAVQAEGPMLNGVVKAVDAEKRSLTVGMNTRGGEAEEKALEVAPNAVIHIDDGKGRRFSLRDGKLADVPVGAAVSVKLSSDQKLVGMVRAEGPVVSGRVKSVDAKVGSITIELFVARGENPVEKTYSVAKNVRIVIEGNEGKLADIKVGEDGHFTTLRLSLDQKTVQGITASPGRSRERE